MNAHTFIEKCSRGPCPVVFQFQIVDAAADHLRLALEVAFLAHCGQQRKSGALGCTESPRTVRTKSARTAPHARLPGALQGYHIAGQFHVWQQPGNRLRARARARRESPPKGFAKR